MLIVIIFSVQNSDLMQVKFIYYQFYLPKAVLLFVSLMIGAFLAVFWHTIRYVDFSRVIREFSNKIKELEKAVKEKDEEIVFLKNSIAKENIKESEKNSPKSQIS
jgi:hypothetical protein